MLKDVYKQRSRRRITRLNCAFLIRLHLKVDYLLRHHRKGNRNVKSDKHIKQKVEKDDSE